MSFCINVALRPFKASQAPQNENVKAAERYNRIGSWQKWTEGVRAQRAESVRRKNAKQKIEKKHFPEIAKVLCCDSTHYFRAQRELTRTMKKIQNKTQYDQV